MLKLKLWRRKSLTKPKMVTVKEEDLSKYLYADSLTVVHALASWGGASVSMPKTVLQCRFVGDCSGEEKEQKEKRLENVLQSLQEKNCVADDGEYVSWCGSWSCTNCIYCHGTCTKRGIASMVGGAKHCQQYHPKQIGGS